ncbi:MAG: hypothetical protein J5922_04160 [Clostridia bacterium]|nr:hypothetical protein [Clostridia bacterium]
MKFSECENADSIAKRCETVKENKTAIAEEISNSVQKRLLTSDDAANIIVSLFPSELASADEAAKYLVCEEFSQRLFDEGFISSDFASQSPHVSQLLRFDNVNICKSVCEKISEKYGAYRKSDVALGILQSDTALDYENDVRVAPKNRTSNTVAYFNNSYTDRAYKQFSKLLRKPNAVYSESIMNVCEALCYGNAEYGILPIENSKDGSLANFYSLIMRYDLKINAECKIISDDDSTTVFALVSRDLNFDWLNLPSYLAEFSISTDPSSLCRLISSANDLGFSLIKINSTPSAYAYDDMRYVYDCTFKSSGGDISAFVCYLKFFAPRFETVGFYDILSEEAKGEK